MAKTKTLRCAGPPAHFWEFTPKGPGRPPKYCPEHKAALQERVNRQQGSKAEDIESSVNDRAQRQQDLNRGAADLAGTPEGEKLAVMAAEENPFMKQATNLFMKKAQPNPGHPHNQNLCERCGVNERMEGETICEPCMEAETDPNAAPIDLVSSKALDVLEADEVNIKPKPSKHRPMHYEPKTYDEKIIDTQTYNDAMLPGIKIHDIQRDLDGVWTCKVTVNEETFDLILRGGWLIKREDGGYKEALPNVAAAIAARVDRLTPKPDPNEKKKPRKVPNLANQETLEQVADKTVPLEDDHEDKIDKPKRGRPVKREYGEAHEGKSMRATEILDEAAKDGKEIYAEVEGDEGTILVDDSDGDTPDDLDDMSAMFASIDEAFDNS